MLKTNKLFCILLILLSTYADKSAVCYIVTSFFVCEETHKYMLCAGVRAVGKKMQAVHQRLI